MKLSELFKIKEHLTSHYDKPVSNEQLKLWRVDGVRQEQAITVEGKSIVIFIAKPSPNIALVILTERETQQEPVGYCTLQKTGKYWMIMDVHLNPGIRGRGITLNLYRSLVALGYHLRSGNVLSKSAEKMWLKIGASGRAKVLNVQTGSIEDFSDKPIFDKSVEPTHVWIMENGWAPAWDRVPTWSRTKERGIALEWLEGKPLNENTSRVRWPSFELN
jgi:hypothetical protein